MTTALVLGLAVLAVAGVSATAYADGDHIHLTPQQNNPISYHNMTISYDIQITAALNDTVDTLPVNYTDILDRSVYDGLRAWADLNPNLKILNSTEANHTMADYTISVLVEPYDPNESIGWGYTGGLYGNDHYTQMGIEAHTYDCTGQPAWYWSMSLRDTVAHEFGHLLGFGHNSNKTHLMYGTDPAESLPGVDVYDTPENLSEHTLVQGQYELSTNHDFLLHVTELYDITLSSYEEHLDAMEDDLDALEGKMNSVPGSTMGPDGTLHFIDQGAYGYYLHIYQEYEELYQEYEELYADYMAEYDTRMTYHYQAMDLYDQLTCMTTPLVPPDTAVDGGA